jgi:hypothetical protein
VLATNVNDLTLSQLETPADPSIGARFSFPIYAATGAAASAVVYFEVAPGKRLGRSLAVVPALMPHDIRNTGSIPLRVVGFFAGSALMHAFSEPLLPGAEVMIVAHGPEGEALFAGTPFVPAMVG